MEEIQGSADALNPSRHLAGLIARSLAKLPGSQTEGSGPKFRTLYEILRSHLVIDDASKIIVFSESQ